MTTFLLVLAGVAVLLILAVLFSYNRFVEQRVLIRDSWANVETELQRRYDLIPNLVETVQGYAAHERQVLDEVAVARARAAASHGSPDEQARDENALVGALRHLFAVSEAYPELKANRSFLHLQQQLSITEDRIQAARRFYNANVRDWNRRVQAVPSNVVAAWFRFTEARYFELDEAVRRAGAPSATFGPASRP